MSPSSSSANDAPAIAEPSTTAGIRHAVRALRHRDFRVFWLGAVVSNTGSWVQSLAAPYVIYELTSSALWVGAATFVQFIPNMMLSPVGGWMADQYDRRRVLIVMQLMLAATAALLGLCWTVDLRSPLLILAFVGLTGVLTGLAMPTWQAFVNDLVPRRDLLSAVTLNSLQVNAARAIGPAIAGGVLASVGAGWAFCITAISFVAALIPLVALGRGRDRATRRPSTRWSRQFSSALSYARSELGVRRGIAIAAMVGALGSPIAQFTIVFGTDVFRVGAEGVSLLNVALGAGTIAAAPLVSGWDTSLSRATLSRWALVVYGSSVTLFALAPSFALGLACLVAVGGSFLVVISATNTAVQLLVADEMRGSVLALRIMVFTGAYPVGALVQGWIADQIGARWTVGIAGSMLLVVAAMCWRPGYLDPLDGDALTLGP